MSNPQVQFELMHAGNIVLYRVKRFGGGGGDGDVVLGKGHQVSVH
jgi:hypothetical protein